MIGAAFKPGETRKDDAIGLVFPFGAFEMNVPDAQALHNALGVALGIRDHAEKLLSEGDIDAPRP